MLITEIKFRLTLLICILIPLKFFAQSKDLYSCEKIEKGVVDSKLYKDVQGKLFLEINDFKGKVFKISNTNTKKIYYVSRKLKKRIRKSIKKNKCNSIRISYLDKMKNE